MASGHSLVSRLVAHRGYRACYPENTLIAYEAAVARGAHFVELDVQLSRDAVPVLYHDRTLYRVSRQQGAIHQYTLAELSHFRAFEYDRFGYRFAQNPICTLADFVTFLAQHPHVTAFVEMKRVMVERFGADVAAAKVLATIAPVAGQCVIISYDLDILLAVRERGWERIGAVVDHWRERRNARLRTLRPQYLFCDEASLPRRGRLHFDDAQLAVFQTSDPARARTLFRRGIALVETDDIGGMIAALAGESG
ncbi:MAG TPA: glycerophosphodiester phosphodiesterase [Gammaproteobacteria bacterium]|nr:glycerophosphodiester phosphodiesterase [Gammaproteobacteria bacterium]